MPILWQIISDNVRRQFAYTHAHGCEAVQVRYLQRKGVLVQHRPEATQTFGSRHRGQNVYMQCLRQDFLRTKIPAATHGKGSRRYVNSGRIGKCYSWMNSRNAGCLVEQYGRMNLTCKLHFTYNQIVDSRTCSSSIFYSLKKENNMQQPRNKLTKTYNLLI